MTDWEVLLKTIAKSRAPRHGYQGEITITELELTQALVLIFFKNTFYIKMFVTFLLFIFIIIFFYSDLENLPGFVLCILPCLLFFSFTFFSYLFLSCFIFLTFSVVCFLLSCWTPILLCRHLLLLILLLSLHWSSSHFLHICVSSLSLSVQNAEILCQVVFSWNISS